MFQSVKKVELFHHKMESDADILDIHIDPLEKMEIEEEEYCCEIDKLHNCVFVDLQGFKKSKNQFICKEFCYLNDFGIKYHVFVKSPSHFHTFPPYYHRLAIWQMKHYHKIDYNFGDTNLNDFRELMYPQLSKKIVLVKGMEKVTLIKKMFNEYGRITCLDIMSMGFDLSHKQAGLYNVCEYHKSIPGWTQGPCALTNAFKIRDLAEKNIELRSWLASRDRDF